MVGPRRAAADARAAGQPERQLRTYTVLACIVALSPAIAFADLMTIRCEDPLGSFLFHGPDIYDGQFKSRVTPTERFGSSPTFLLDSRSPTRLTVLWGSATPPGMPAELKKALESDPKHAGKASDATIVFQSDDQFTAVERYDQGVYLYSLFPKLGYGVFSDHGHALNGQVKVNTFYGTCQFIK